MSLKIKYNTREECLQAVKEDGLNIRFCNLDYRKDDEIAKTAIANDGLALLYTPYEYCLSYDVAMAAVKSNGLAYFCLPKTLRQDEAIALTAVMEYSYIYPYIDCTSISCEGLRLETIKNDATWLPRYYPNNEFNPTQYIGAQEYNHETYCIIAKVLDESNGQVFATFWKGGKPFGVDYYEDIQEARDCIDREMLKLKNMERDRMHKLGGIDTTITRRSYDHYVIDSQRDEHPENAKKYEVEDAIEAKKVEQQRERYRVEHYMDNMDEDIKRNLNNRYSYDR